MLISSKLQFPCVLVFAIQPLLFLSWQSLPKKFPEQKLFKVSCKGFNEMLFKFVLRLLLLALNKFLFPVSCCYVTSTICQLAKSFNKNFGGVNFSLNKTIQNINQKSVLKYIHLQKLFQYFLAWCKYYLHQNVMSKKKFFEE